MVTTDGSEGAGLVADNEEVGTFHMDYKELYTGNHL